MMRKAVWPVVVLLMCRPAVFAQGINVLSAEERANGWQLLFDGKTLAGWHVSAAPPAAGRGASAAPPIPGQIGTPKPCVTAANAHWEVVDGLLTACGEPTGYLTSDRSFRNFVLTIEFKTGADTNSGVFVRSPQENGGYEVQIWRRQPAGYNTGGIVNVAKTAREFAFKADDWNRYRITAEGDHIVIELNGEKTLDIHDAKFAEGNLRLQYQQFPIAFRNIKLRALP